MSAPVPVPLDKVRVLQREAQVQLDVMWRHSYVVRAQRPLAGVHASGQCHGAGARAACRSATRLAQRARTVHTQTRHAQCAQSGKMQGER